MTHQEKKYRVESFADIERKLAELGAQKQKRATTHHYYTDQIGNDAIKLIKYEGRNEIHILKESSGKYTLIDRIKVKDTEAGLELLKAKGLKVTAPLKMTSINYRYKKRHRRLIHHK